MDDEIEPPRAWPTRSVRAKRKRPQLMSQAFSKHLETSLPKVECYQLRRQEDWAAHSSSCADRSCTSAGRFRLLCVTGFYNNTVYSVCCCFTMFNGWKHCRSTGQLHGRCAFYRLHSKWLPRLVTPSGHVWLSMRPSQWGGDPRHTTINN